ncbi:MAG: phosphatidylglycerophosphatase A [Pseudomonadota bacterium]
MKTSTKKITWQTIRQHPLLFIAFGFGTGLAPIAPGTVATLVAVPIFLLLNLLPLWFYSLILVIFTLFAMWLSDWASKKIDIHDHPGMNIDEIVGFLFAMWGLPSQPNLIILGFLLFRFFDIVKPWPISWIDKHIRNGAGMILDDIAAAIPVCVILHVIFLLFPAV